MPTKVNEPGISRDLISTGTKHIFRSNGFRDEVTGEKPTTSLAIALRNEKLDVQGTGEVALLSKPIGREKLDLLAEHLVDLASRATLAAPFSLEECLKIAESQCDAFIDDIVNLKNSDIFCDIMRAEIIARKSVHKEDLSDPTQEPSHVARVVATKIHNFYMLASAWHFVVTILHDLQSKGVTHATLTSKLKNDIDFRERYLALYDIVTELVNTFQAKFSVLATTTPHYSRYFTHKHTATGESEVVFYVDRLREACSSFLDSIVLELCFPREMYPKHILFQLLRDTTKESPGEAKRFPQALWDSVGDLSVSVELLEILERPLLSPEGDAWKNFPRGKSVEYEQRIDAQVYSEKVSDNYRNMESLIYPLEKTQDQTTLDDLWKLVNLNYKAVSGVGINSLWHLKNAFRRTPR